MRRGLGEIVFWFFNRRMRPSASAVWLDPNIPIVHQLNLPLDHLLAVLGMFHRDAVGHWGIRKIRMNDHVGYTGRSGWCVTMW